LIHHVCAPLLTRATLWGFFCMSLWVYICVSNFTYKRALWGYIYVQRYIVGVFWYSHKKIPNLIQNCMQLHSEGRVYTPHKALLNALEYISIVGVLPQCRKHPQCSCMMKFTPTMYLLYAPTYIHTHTLTHGAHFIVSSLSGRDNNMQFFPILK
jgi:hypothetical protein